jgi:hypothetical protein
MAEFGFGDDRFTTLGAQKEESDAQASAGVCLEMQPSSRVALDPMRRYRLPVTLAVLVGGLVACNSAPIFGGCTDDLRTRVDPPSRSLTVGESYVGVASAWGCSGSKRLSDKWRYFVVDTTVARVDSVTGRVTARAPGVTDVGARGAVYGDALNRSRVTVTLR